jgi:phage baseplate assembly protein W
MAYYKGFNTIDNTFSSVRTNDSELVKRDILNSFLILQGQKLMNPTYGSILTAMAWDPLTPELESVVLEEVKNVISREPRVTINDISLTSYRHGIQVAVSLNYVNSDLSEELFVRFNRDSQTIDIVNAY